MFKEEVRSLGTYIYLIVITIICIAFGITAIISWQPKADIKEFKEVELMKELTKYSKSVNIKLVRNPLWNSATYEFIDVKFIDKDSTK
jgi:hypothetical protein